MSDLTYTLFIVVQYVDTDEEVFDILQVTLPQSAHVTGADLIDEIHAAFHYDPVLQLGRMDAAEQAFADVIVAKYGGEWEYIDTAAFHLYFGKDDA